MKAYLLAVAGAVILSAVVSCLVSDGKMGKFIRGMSRLFVFSALLVPLLSLFTKEEFRFASAKMEEDEAYLAYCAHMLEDEDEERIANLILKDYAVELQIKAERGTESGFPLKKITVKVSDSGLSEEEEHIHILSCISELLKEHYSCKTEVVWQERE